MSSLLKKNKLFLEYLLDKNTQLNQKQAIIFTGSDTQLNTVAEILYNISTGVIPVSKNTRNLLQKHRLLIKKINKVSGKARSKLLRSKYKQVCDLLLSVRNLILDLLA